MIINYSTGAIGVPLEKRIAYLRELRPDVAALNMGSMNYAKYSRAAQGLRLPDGVRELLRRRSSSCSRRCNELGIRPEHECFDVGPRRPTSTRCSTWACSTEPLQISCVMGVTGGIRPTARNLAHMAEQIPGGPTGRTTGA